MQFRLDPSSLNDVLSRVQRIAKPSTRNKIARRAVDKASQPVAKAAKRLAPVSSEPPLIPGLLRKAQGRKVKTYGARGVSVAVVGSRTDFRRQIGVRVRGKKAGQPIYQDPVKYDHLVELGHGGPAPASPHPFMRVALDTTRGQALSILRTEMAAGVDAEARR